MKKLLPLLSAFLVCGSILVGCQDPNSTSGAGAPNTSGSAPTSTGTAPTGTAPTGGDLAGSITTALSSVSGLHDAAVEVKDGKVMLKGKADSNDAKKAATAAAEAAVKAANGTETVTNMMTVQAH